MAAYLNVRARYSKGTLKLSRKLRLPEGTEVRVTVVPVTVKSVRGKARSKFRYPNRPLPAKSLKELVGIVSLGGDALADSEALYDGD